MTFEITITFSGDISQSYTKELLHNLVDALRNQVDGAGLTPDLSGEYTEAVDIVNKETSMGLGWNFKDRMYL